MTQRFIGMKLMESGKKISKSNGSSRRKASQPLRRKLAVCLESGEADLTRGAVYELIHDKKGSAHGYVRVFDDSGEDYLYPSSFFLPIRLPKSAHAALAKVLGG